MVCVKPLSQRWNNRNSNNYIIMLQSDRIARCEAARRQSTHTMHTCDAVYKVCPYVEEVLRVNACYECDMSGQICSLPGCYSVHAVKGVRSAAADRTADCKGPSEDRPLKWGQTAEWQCHWTPDCTRPIPCRFDLIHGQNTSIFSSHLASYSARKMDLTWRKEQDSLPALNHFYNWV